MAEQEYIDPNVYTDDDNATFWDYFWEDHNRTLLTDHNSSIFHHHDNRGPYNHAMPVVDSTGWVLMWILASSLVHLWHTCVLR